MLTKSRTHIKIPLDEWERLKKNPALADTIELLEDISDLEGAKKIKGDDLTIEEYLAKRELSNKD